MECKKCGKINYATATTCVMCGSPLEQAPIQSNIYEDDYANKQNRYDEDTSSNDTEIEPEEPKKPRSKSTLIIISVAVVVLLLIILFIFLRSGSDDSLKVGFRIEDNTNDSLVIDKDYIFSDTTRNATSWLWDFGNGETSTEKVFQTKYATTGTFKVVLTVNGTFTYERMVYVSKGAGAFAPPEPPPINIEGIKDAYKVGEKIVLKDITAGAENWRWTDESKQEVAAIGQSLELTFKEPGKYKYALTNSLYSNPYMFDIKVIASGTPPPSPPPGPPNPPKPKSYDINKLNVEVNKIQTDTKMEGRAKTDTWKKLLQKVLGNNDPVVKYFDDSKGGGKESNEFRGLLLGIEKNTRKITIKRVEKDKDNPNVFNIYFE